MKYVILATVVITLLTAMIGLIASLGNRRKISEVHVLVNSQLTTVVDRVAVLTEALKAAGKEIPPE